jgi:hypothetical protein
MRSFVMDRIRVSIGLAVVTLLVFVSMPIGKAQNPSTANHKAAGSWFGRAVQVCEQGVSAVVCDGTGLPARALLMTPTLTPDGLFLGNDTLSFQSPHLTAHGMWTATSQTGFEADYAFAASRIPGFRENTVSALRFCWRGEVLDDNTLVGWVNAYVTPAIPIWWQRLERAEFPGFPSEALPIVTKPSGFVNDPATCRTSGCPLVFKFTIKRVSN